MADYIQEMEQKLQASRQRVKVGREMKALKQSAPTLFEIIDTEISLAVNKMTQTEPLSREEYLSLHGQVLGVKRIRNLIDSREVEESQAAEEVKAIEENIKLVKDNGS